MDPLQRVRLGTTDLEVTRVSLGCAPIGGLYSNIPDEQATRVVRTALEAGINFIDTAALYGAGTSERRVGAALRGVARDRYVLATKVGWRFEHVPGPSGFSEYWDSPGAWMVECVNDYSADWVERSLENSLTRLGIDRLDVVHIHDPDEDEQFAEVMDGAYPVLDRLRSQGVIGAVGAGMNQSEMLARLARAGDFDCFLLAGRYTILEQGALDELLPLCLEKDISIIAGGTYNSGHPGHRLAGRPRRRALRLHGGAAGDRRQGAGPGGGCGHARGGPARRRQPVRAGPPVGRLHRAGHAPAGTGAGQPGAGARGDTVRVLGRVARPRADPARRAGSGLTQWPCLTLRRSRCRCAPPSLPAPRTRPPPPPRSPAGGRRPTPAPGAARAAGSSTVW